MSDNKFKYGDIVYPIKEYMATNMLVGPSCTLKVIKYSGSDYILAECIDGGNRPYWVGDDIRIPDKYLKRQTRVHGWLKNMQRGSAIWLVKENKRVEIMEPWHKQSSDIGIIGLSGEESPWYVDIDGCGFDKQLLMVPVR